MSTYGRQVLESVGRSPQVTADGAPVAKAGGVTIDWALVTAHSADTTYLNGDIVYDGEKFLRYGQIVCKVTATGKYAPFGAAGVPVTGDLIKGECYILNESVHENQPHSDYPPAIDGGRIYKNRLIVGKFGGVNEVQTITIGAGNTGGTFTVTYSGQTTSALAHNASADALKAALLALSNINDGEVEVSKSGEVFTITFVGNLQGTNIAAVTTTPSLTGGANTAVVATATGGAISAGPALVDFERVFPDISYVPE